MSLPAPAYRALLRRAHFLVWLALSLLLPYFCHAQPGRWTVSYHEGSRDTIVSIQRCRLLSCTSDSLIVVADSLRQAVPLYLLSDLSLPDTSGFHYTPVFVGAAIGVGAAVLFSGAGGSARASIESEGTTAALFGAIGAGLGLVGSVNQSVIKYHFTFGETYPDKCTTIRQIIASEQVKREPDVPLPPH